MGGFQISSRVLPNQPKLSQDSSLNYSRSLVPNRWNIKVLLLNEGLNPVLS